ATDYEDEEFPGAVPPSVGAR
nr:RecName: Full=Fibrinogen beta chain; Contains: RecName: Full=Fibrinopeptide B [Elephas maximus]prf//721948D fibrinopeptide B [Elephas maximus]